jgi:hypothetical protein
MKRIFSVALVMAFFVCSSDNISAEKQSLTPIPTWEKEVEFLYATIQDCASKRDSIEQIGFADNDYLFDLFQVYDDSVTNLNRKLLSNIVNIDWSNTQFNDVKKYFNSNGLITVSSQDESLHFISWDTYTGGNIPSYVSLSLVYSNGKANLKVFTAHNGVEKKDVGENMLPDRITQFINSLGKKIYLVFSENKCGSICILKKVRAYSIKEGNIKEFPNLFKDDRGTYSYLSFEYYINSKDKTNPDFTVDSKRKLIIRPEYGRDKTIEIGRHNYKIDIQNNDVK